MHHLRFDGLRSMTDDKSHQTTSQSSQRSRPIICVCVKRAHCSRASKKKTIKNISFQINSVYFGRLESPNHNKIYTKITDTTYKSMINS